MEWLYQEAIEAFTAKKKLEEQRYELKQYLMFTHGSKSWDDLLAMEGQIRKRRQKEVYDKQVFREKVITYVVLAVVLRSIGHDGSLADGSQISAGVAGDLA